MKTKSRPTSVNLSRREFLRDSALLSASVAAGLSSARAADEARKPLNHNPNMEYRRLGKTGLLVSAVCLGGHWKRLDAFLPGLFKDGNWLDANLLNSPDFVKNRTDVVSWCSEAGMNYIDACTGPEVMAYAKALEGRRGQMYLGYSWYEKEARFEQWRTKEQLLKSLDEGMQAAKLDYVDLWRITCHEQGGNHTFNESEEIIAALDTAKQQGKARFAGVSSHDRRWLKMMLERHPQQMDVIVTPYTAKSKVLPTDGLFDAVKKCDVGVFGIKPFAGNSLFKGDSSLGSPDAGEDSRRARLAVRNILCNPAITAPIPGLINKAQVDNLVTALRERRELDAKEAAELEKANTEAWAKLDARHQWLKDWEWV
jgi:aryl-alcohol dehydrogenase-like predicted oxidoreductase